MYNLSYLYIFILIFVSFSHFFVFVICIIIIIIIYLFILVFVYTVLVLVLLVHQVTIKLNENQKVFPWQLAKSLIFFLFILFQVTKMFYAAFSFT